MSTLDYELSLFKETLDWVKGKTLPTTDFIPYYENYYQRASTHAPILSEDWGEFNTRHGANSVRGTTSELLTTAALLLSPLGVKEVSQITDKTQQGYGSDLIVKTEKKEYIISCKTCKPRNVFTEGQLDTQLRLFRDYFEPAIWRVTFLSLIHPVSKKVWLFNYGILASIHCSINEGGFCKPVFESPSVAFSVTTLTQKFPDALIPFDLTKE